MPRRVAITGIGILGPVGVGKEAFWRSCLEGTAAVAPIPDHWHRYHTYHSKIWAPLPPIDFGEFDVSRVERMQLDPAQMLALAGAREALTDAGFGLRLVNEKKNTFAIENTAPEQWGTFVGTGIGGMATYTGCAGNHILSPVKNACERQAREGGQTLAASLTRIAHDIDMPARFNRYAVSMSMPNACSATVSIKYSLRGPSITPCCACASGTAAIGHAYRAIRCGEVERAVAGGAEYLADPYGGIFRGFDTARALALGGEESARANRPFDTGRTGFLFAEGGCGMLVLEELSRARDRGAHCFAEIIGYEENADAYSIMGMEPGGTAIDRLTENLVRSAGVGPDEIDYINSHGTGTQANDEAESAVVEKVFGSKPFVNSTKSLAGHTIGAAGAIEAAVTAMSIDRGRIHRCVNLCDPVRDLNFPRDTIAADIGTALSYSFAFGGHNAGLAFRRL